MPRHAEAGASASSATNVISQQPAAAKQNETSGGGVRDEDVRALEEGEGVYEEQPGCCSWLCCKMVCWFFCCPPCPSRIVAKQAFLPPQ